MQRNGREVRKDLLPLRPGGARAGVVAAVAPHVTLEGPAEGLVGQACEHGFGLLGPAGKPERQAGETGLVVVGVLQPHVRDPGLVEGLQRRLGGRRVTLFESGIALEQQGLALGRRVGRVAARQRPRGVDGIVHERVDVGDGRPVDRRLGTASAVLAGVVEKGLKHQRQVPCALRGIDQIGRRRQLAPRGGGDRIEHAAAFLPADLLAGAPGRGAHEIAPDLPPGRAARLGVAHGEAVLLGGFLQLEHARVGVSPAVGHARAVLVGGQAGEGAGDELDRLGRAAGVDQIGPILDGLGAAVDVLGRLGGQLLQVLGASREGRRRDAVAAHGERESAGARQHQIAVDVQVVAEPLVQQTADLADGHARLRNLDLHVRRPGAAGLEATVGGAGRRLKLAQSVEHAGGHHFARDPASREGGRRLEGFDHHGARGEGVDDHHHGADHHENHHDRHERLHGEAKPLAGPAEPPLHALLDQVGETMLALPHQFLGLQVEQVRLALEEAPRGLGHRRIVFGLVRSEGGREGFGARPLPNFGGELRRLLAGAHGAGAA